MIDLPEPIMCKPTSVFDKFRKRHPIKLMHRYLRNLAKFHLKAFQRKIRKRMKSANSLVLRISLDNEDKQNARVVKISKKKQLKEKVYENIVGDNGVDPDICIAKPFQRDQSDVKLRNVNHLMQELNGK